MCDLGFTDKGKSCPSCDFLTSQVCLLTLFAKIKCLRKFPDLLYTLNNGRVFLEQPVHCYIINDRSYMTENNVDSIVKHTHSKQ